MSVNHRLTDNELLGILTLSKTATAIYTTNDIIIQHANNAMLAFWGKDKSIIGKPLLEAVPELEGQPFIPLLQSVLKLGVIHDGVLPATTLINSKKQTRQYEFEYRAIKNSTGEPYGILHTASDVTDQILGKQAIEKSEEQKQALAREQTLNEELTAINEELHATNEELNYTRIHLHNLNAELEERIIKRIKDLAASEARFRSLVEQAPIAIALFKSPDLIIDIANDRMLETWGKAADIHGKPLAMAMPELKGQPFIDILRDVLASGEPYYGYERWAQIIRNGKLVEGYFNFICQPIRDGNSNITSVLQVVSEITDQIRSRRELESAEKKLRLAIQSAGMGTWSANLDTDELTLDDKSKEIHGIAANQSVTLTESFALIQTQYRDIVESAIKNTIEQNKTFEQEYIIHPKDSSRSKWLKSTGITTYNKDGKPVTLSGTILDITEQKQDEQRKNDFIGMVSHEMKTPLTTISAYLQMLLIKVNQADKATVSMLQKSNKQIERMTTLINGFLNVSRLESGKIQIDEQRFDMAELVKETEEEIRTMYNSHHFIFHPVERTLVNADRDKIEQVIHNLISNAVKYSPANSTIHIACVTVDGVARVSIKDEGIGVRAEDIPKLFERYYRVKNDLSHLVAGFGIGLYLCSEIIHRHDGKIWLESEEGKGSVFYFTLPVIK